MKSKYLSSRLIRINLQQEKISKLRLGVGIVTLVCWFYPVIFSSGMAVLYPLSFLFVIAFVYLVYQASRLREFKDYLLQREKIEDRRESQFQTDFKYTPEQLSAWGLLLSKMNIDKSPHWDDLDITKSYGLLQSIHSTGNPEALQFLINLMKREPLTASAIQDRQNKVRILTSGPRRKSLALLTLNPETSSVSSTQVLLKESLVENSLWVYLSYAYYLSLWISYGFYLFSGATVFGLFLLGLFFLFPLANSQVKIFKTLSWVSGFEAQLIRLKKMKKVIRHFSKQARTANNSILKSYLESPTIPSFETALSELNLIIGAMGLRQNIILYAIVHAFLPWDFYWTARAEGLRKKLETIYLAWIEDLVEFEAYSLLAEYSENIRNSVWPSLEESSVSLVAKNISHPLIPARFMVPNDVELNPTNRKCLLLTGSNMSGKSTFLRTVGINLILMRVGAKVHASQFSSAPFQVLTSLKRTDSLEESLSTFYSEVKNLKEIRDESISHVSLYLIDEIFRGTNNRERLIGAQKYIKALLQSPSLGMVTTHDLELSQMDQEYQSLINEHFADTIVDGKMSFDYKKKVGPCPSTNALKVMEMEGVF